MLRKNTLSLLILGLCAAMFGYMAWIRGNEALWNDEIYTLQYFVLKGLPSVLTDYHVPNNHILSNILHWGWLKLLGIQEIGSLLDHAWKIRIVSGLLSVGTLVVLYRCGQLIYSKFGGLIAVLLASSMLGFGSFAFQVRGYALSMLLMSVLMYSALKVIRQGYFSRGAWNTIAACTTLLLYSIPSNLYPIMAIGAMLLLVLGLKEKSAWIQVSTAFGAGAILAVALYWPVMDQVLNNDYVKSGKPLRAIHVKNLQIFLEHLGGWKLLTLPLLAWGAWVLQKDGHLRKYWWLLGGTVLLPFLISMLRGDEPPPRAFVVLLPVFVVLLTLIWSAATDKLAQKKELYSFLQVGGVAICIGSLWLADRDAKKEVANGMVERILLQSINYGYYQYYYKPNEEYDLFKQKYPGQTLIIETAEQHDMPVYLNHKQIKSVPLDSIYPMMEQQNTIFVSTRYPKNFIQNMEKMKGGWRCTYLQNQIRYPRIVVCKK